MKTLDLADVNRLPEELKSLRDGGRAVAKVVPVSTQTLEERMDELARQGKVRKGTGTLPDDFFTRPLPKAKASVLEQLLEDRRTGR